VSCGSLVSPASGFYLGERSVTEQGSCGHLDLYSYHKGPQKKGVFRCWPLDLAFHTYLTLDFTTRKLCPCGRNLRLRTGFGECHCGLFRRVGSIVTTCSHFWSLSWCLPSLVATLLRTSFLYLVISSLDLRKSYTFIVFGGSPVPFWALPIWA